jgi:hypothetical protein
MVGSEDGSNEKQCVTCITVSLFDITVLTSVEYNYHAYCIKSSSQMFPSSYSAY